MKIKKLLSTAIGIFLLFTSMQSVKAQIFNATWGNQFQTALDNTLFTEGIKGASVSVYSPGQGLWTGVSGSSSLGVPLLWHRNFRSRWNSHWNRKPKHH